MNTYVYDYKNIRRKLSELVRVVAMLKDANFTKNMNGKINFPGWRLHITLLRYAQIKRKMG